MQIKLRNIFFLILFSFSLNILQAQIDFLQKSFNLGILENWSETPAEFVFVNRGNSPAAIISIEKDEDLYVKYSHGFIQPNQKSILQVYFEPRNTGLFVRKIRVFVSSSKKPIELVIRGKVEAILECPGPGASYYFYTSNSFLLNGIVLDSKTNLPVDHATVRFVTPYSQTSSERTPKNGRFQKKLETGSYAVIVEVKGYEPYNEILQFNKKNNFLCINLVPLSEKANAPFADSLSEPPEETYTYVPEPENDSALLSNDQQALTSKSLSPLNPAEYRPNNLVFLVDVSENPANPEKLAKLKSLISALPLYMRTQDYISIIIYTDTFANLLYPISFKEKAIIEGVVDNLSLSGKSVGICGLEASYKMILRNYIAQGNNQIIIISDKFNIPPVPEQTRLYNLGKEISYNDIKICIADMGQNQNNGVFKQFIKAVKADYFVFGQEGDMLEKILGQIRQHSKK